MRDVTIDDIRFVSGTDPATDTAVWMMEVEAVGSRYDLWAVWDVQHRLLMVSLPNFRVSWYFNARVHWDYVSEKLNLSRPDAQAVALIINGIHDQIRATT